MSADDDHAAVTPQRTREAVTTKLGIVRTADATTELKALGFDFDASAGKVRLVKCKIPNSETAAFVVLRTQWGEGRVRDRLDWS